MKLETDLTRIQRLAEERERANWAFRSFLKASDLSAARIDRAVREAFRSAAAQIDCTRCANCCKVVGPVLGPVDVKRLAAAQGIPVRKFRARYLGPADGERGEKFCAKPCPLLEDNRCTVYEHRPRDCRSFPHLHKKDFVFRLAQAVSNCSLCPIVFHVYEELKAELWKR